MTDPHLHKLLIVDTDKNTFTLFDEFLEKEKAKCAFAQTAEEALQLLKEGKPGFSIIIAEQNLKDMNGIKFLEQVQELSPYSSLFLMSDHSDTKAIVTAVNLGIIQRYIKKPLESKSLCITLLSGIQAYEFLIDSEKLFRLAKKQNKKLYELNCELMEATKSHTREFEALEEKINLLKKEIKERSETQDTPPDFETDKLNAFIGKENNPAPEQFKTLYFRTIQELHTQFSELALRKGFEMPPLKTVDMHEPE